MSGNLPPGVTDHDIDAAAPGYYDPPCEWIEDDDDIYCAYCGAKWEWQCAPEKRR